MQVGRIQHNEVTAQLEYFYKLLAVLLEYINLVTM